MLGSLLHGGPLLLRKDGPARGDCRSSPHFSRSCSSPLKANDTPAFSCFEARSSQELEPGTWGLWQQPLELFRHLTELLKERLMAGLRFDQLETDVDRWEKAYAALSQQVQERLSQLYGDLQSIMQQARQQSKAVEVEQNHGFLPALLFKLNAVLEVLSGKDSAASHC